jgi:LuxR family transcriptional regulator
MQAGYLESDPTVQHCRRSQAPVIWSDTVFQSTPELWDDAQSFGLKVGWAQSSLDAYGGGGMLTLCRSSEAISESELQEKQVKMRWLANIAHMALARVLAAPGGDDDKNPLTPKEVDILKWCADGKTSSEIAEIMDISINTVNFHVKNASSKLHTANKTAAVVRAAMMGLLS